MAADNQPTTIPNEQEPAKPFTVIHISASNIIKLTPTNYLSWKLQLEAVLIGYDLYKFIDGSHPCPPPTTLQHNVSLPNPDYSTWVRQDKLIFGALVGTLTSSLIPLIQQAKTTRDAWTTLADTFARPSRGHIKQLKDQIKTAVKGSQSITEYLQFIKSRANELAALGKPMEHEDLIEKILDGLDEDYKSIIDVIEERS